MLRIYTGWRIVFAMTVAALTAFGVGTYAFALFLKPLEEEFGWSRAVVSGSISAFWLSAPLIFLIGRGTERFGARRLMLAGTIVEAASLLLISRVVDVWQFYVLRFAMGAGMLLIATSMPIVVCRWFERRRGLAMSIVFAGFQLGGVVVAPLAQALIERLGWRATAMALGACMLAVNLPVLVAFMTDRRPEELGLRPDGGTVAPGTTAAVAPRAAAEPVILPVGAGNERIATVSFCSILALSAIFYCTESSLLLHQSAFVTDAGISPQIAADALGLIAAIYILGALIAGLWTDRTPARQSIVVIFMLQALAVLVLAALEYVATLWILGAYVAIAGLANGAADIVFVITLRRWFGARAYDRAYTIWYFVTYVTFALAPMLAGYLYDVTGRYRAVFALAFAGTIVAQILWWLTPDRRGASSAATAGHPSNAVPADGSS